ncbi:hypothetical protein CDAR_35111, partial [Caerostris darwini]
GAPLEEAGLVAEDLEEGGAVGVRVHRGPSDYESARFSLQLASEGEPRESE